VSV
ncbi:ABC transporter family protein, partial [Vibrio parahaemolyticus AQ3810]|jgi:hypothetical protein